MTSRGGLTSSVPPARGSRTGRLRPSPENGPRVSRSGAHSAHLSLSPQRTARRRAALCGGGGVRKEGRGIPSSRGCDRRGGNGFDGKEVPFGSGVRKRCLPNTAPTEGGSQSSPSLCPHSPPFEDSETDKGGTVTPTRCPRVPSHRPPTPHGAFLISPNPKAPPWGGGGHPSTPHSAPGGVTTAFFGPHPPPDPPPGAHTQQSASPHNSFSI